MASPTSRTLARLRSLGYLAAPVERWNSFAKVRHDAFGVADILAFDARATLLVQCTTAENLSVREKKVRDWPGLTEWLLGGRKFLLHGWAKRGGRGKRKTWECVEREITLDGRS